MNIYSKSLVIAALFVSLLPSRTHASSMVDETEAQTYGVKIERGQLYDPWMGFTIESGASGLPYVPDARLVSETLGWMKTDRDACYRLAARFIERENIHVVFGPVPDAAHHVTEAYYSHPDNTITISDSKAYLRADENLAKKLIHESFHRVQWLLGLIKTDADFHDYDSREKIINYLQRQFPNEGACKLPDVPPAIRNSVEDTVQAPMPCYPVNLGAMGMGMSAGCGLPPLPAVNPLLIPRISVPDFDGSGQ